MAENERDKVHQEIYEAAEALIQGLEKDIEVEELMEKKLDEDIEHLQQVKQAAKKIMNNEQHEMQDLKDIHQDLATVHKEIQDEVRSTSRNELMNKLDYELSDQVDAIKDAISDIEDFEDNFQEEEYEVELEIEEAVEDAAELKATYQAIYELKQQLRKAKNIEQGLRTIADQEGYNDVKELLREADSGEGAAEDHFGTIQKKEQNLGKEIKEIQSAITQEAQLNQQEIQELREDITGDQKLLKEIKSTLEPLMEKELEIEESEHQSDEHKRHNIKQAVDTVGDLEDGMKNIDKQLEKMLKMKRLEEQGEEDAADQLASMWEDMSQSAQ